MEEGAAGQGMKVVVRSWEKQRNGLSTGVFKGACLDDTLTLAQ